MIYLLDVNVLMAALWTAHAQHAVADAWLQCKQVALCPISEMGFLRISTHPRALGAVMADAEKLLSEFYKDVSPKFVPADLSASGLRAKNSDAVTDLYSARLADHHRMKLVTLNRRFWRRVLCQSLLFDLTFCGEGMRRIIATLGARADFGSTRN